MKRTAVCCVLAALVSGCGSSTQSKSMSDRDAVRAAYTSWAAAVKAGDGKTVCDAMTDAAQKQIVDSARQLGSTNLTDCPVAFKVFAAYFVNAKYTVGKISVNGNTAVVVNPTAGPNDDKSLTLTRQSGVWKLEADNSSSTNSTSSSGVADSQGVDLAIVKKWPAQWCKARVGMTRAQLMKLMGKPTDELSQQAAAAQQSDPQMSWDYAEYQFNAFFNVSDKVRQLDVNDIDLSTSEKKQIKCPFTRT